ncbi:hypothetical protein PATSB16_20390 [Pandoraea thiooxydans]|nr:hypothetical protein PATSB16_20390 [Pandoraea thiooxydans]
MSSFCNVIKRLDIESSRATLSQTRHWRAANRGKHSASPGSSPSVETHMRRPRRICPAIENLCLAIETSAAHRHRRAGFKRPAHGLLVHRALLARVLLYSIRP